MNNKVTLSTPQQQRGFNFPAALTCQSYPLYTGLPYDEKVLLRRIAAGSEAAFSQLFHHWHQRLGEYIFRLTGSASIAEEIVQEVFVTIWTKRELLQDIDKVQGYIYRLSRNRTLNNLRNRARERARNSEWVAISDNTFNTADNENYYQLIDEAITQLPPQQKRAWQLSRREGLMYEDIARQMQLSRETVKRHIQLAVRSIMSYVRQHAELHMVLFMLLYFLC